MPTMDTFSPERPRVRLGIGLELARASFFWRAVTKVVAAAVCRKRLRSIDEDLRGFRTSDWAEVIVYRSKLWTLEVGAYRESCRNRDPLGHKKVRRNAVPSQLTITIRDRSPLSGVLLPVQLQRELELPRIVRRGRFAGIRKQWTHGRHIESIRNVEHID